MDSRIAIKNGTQLRFYNKEGGLVLFTITRELGRGNSCIVYEAYSDATTGDRKLYRIKECYPYKLRITRNNDGDLIASNEDNDVFQEKQEQFRKDFSISNKLFYTEGMYDSMVDQLDIYTCNNTTYIVSAFSSEKTLATYRPESIKECVKFAKKVSHVIGILHDRGYLYLDVKPDNILVGGDLDRRIQLFDFDSLVSLSEIKNARGIGASDLRISYSRGFAPIELASARIRNLGPYTDVYSVGALLYWLLFGKTPTAIDCEENAEFNFSQMAYDSNNCDSQLFNKLSRFFHHVLASFYADRYQNMNEVFEALVELEKCADPLIPRIISTKITRPRYTFGRTDEFLKIDKFIEDKKSHCLFITGMGGIGKSTIVRDYLCSREDKFDVVLYMNFSDTMEKTISSDINIEITTLKQCDAEKTEQRYFDSKIQKIKELVRETKTVIVIDNFTGEIDQEMLAVLQVDWKVIVVSRQAPIYRECEKIEIGAIEDRYALRSIFEVNLDRRIQKEEARYLNQIIDFVAGHTLILELIAKQICNSHLSIVQAYKLTQEHGFSDIAPEKVHYEKDGLTEQDTIAGIIDALFETRNLSSEKKTILKIASLLSADGINVQLFKESLQLQSLDNVNDLARDGWLGMDVDNLSMHPVIQEMIHRWIWSETYIQAATKFLTYFYVEIEIESTKNNYPKKLHDLWIKNDIEYLENVKKRFGVKNIITIRDSIIEKMYKRKGIARTLARVRRERIRDDSPADFEKISRFLTCSEKILNQCQREMDIQKLEIYYDLLYVTVTNMPTYREDYIISSAQQIIAKNKDNIVQQGAEKLLDSNQARNQIAILELYHRILDINMVKGNLGTVAYILEEVKEVAKKARNNKVYAMYYSLLADYYDTLLDGAYDYGTEEEKVLFEKMLTNIEKAIRFSKKDAQFDGRHLYIQHLLFKATVLIRSCYDDYNKIADLINAAGDAILEYTLPYADVRLQYYLVCGWYAALVLENVEETRKAIEKAVQLSEIITPTKLGHIDNIIIPSANLYYELQCYGVAMEILFEGIQICSEHANNEVYARRKQEISNHLLEVGMDAKQYKLCEKIVLFLDQENKEILDPKMKVIIPEEIRNEISQHISE